MPLQKRSGHDANWQRGRIVHFPAVPPGPGRETGCGGSRSCPPRPNRPQQYMAHLPHGLRVPEAGQQTTKKRPYSGKVRSFSRAPAGAICNHGMRFPRLRVASGRSIGQRKSEASRRSPGRLHPRSCQNSLRPAGPAGLWQGARSDEVPAAGRAALRDSRLPTNRPRAAITPA